MRLAAFGLGLLLAQGTWAGDAGKGKGPALGVRATPRMAFSPVNVLLVAELTGGDDTEEFYCPEIEWDFDDGSKSLHEADCAPYEAGMKIERRYSAEHVYERAGVYNVIVTLRRGNRTLRKQSVQVNVRPGVSDPSNVGSDSW
jgi:hypothetical protein